MKKNTEYFNLIISSFIKKGKLKIVFISLQPISSGVGDYAVSCENYATIKDDSATIKLKLKKECDLK